MASFTPYALAIMFIRKNNTDTPKPETDDDIRVRKDLATGEFELTFRDRQDAQLHVVHVLHSLYRQRVIDHIYLTLKNQSMDEEGFPLVQFSLPGMPNMLVSAEKFNDAYFREHFLELIENALDNLDVLESTKVRVPCTHQNTCMQESGHLQRTLNASLDTHLRKTIHPRLVQQQRQAWNWDNHSAETLEPIETPKRRSARLASTVRHLYFDE